MALINNLPNLYYHNQHGLHISAPYPICPLDNRPGEPTPIQQALRNVFRTENSIENVWEFWKKK